MDANPEVMTSASTYTQGCYRCHATGYNFVGNNVQTSGPTYVGSSADWATQGLATGYTTWGGPEPTSVSSPIPVEGGTANAYTFTTLTDAQLPRAPDTMSDGSSSWYLTGVRCERCHAGGYATPNSTANLIPSAAAPVYEKDGPSGGSSSVAGTWPTAPANMQATGLCMQCHRQEQITSGKVSSPGSITIPTQPQVTDGGKCSDGITAGYAACVAISGNTWNYKPSPNHEFEGQEFLASPHAMFNPQGTVKMAHQNSADLTLLEGPGTITDPSQYSSNNAAQASYQSAGITQTGMANNGCVGCHDAHYTTVNGPQSETNQTVGILSGATKTLPNGTAGTSPTQHNCSSCHTTIANNLMGSVAHPMGAGTPFPYGQSTNPDTACFICHMNGQSGTAGTHLFQMNPDPNYYTYGTAAQFYSTAKNVGGTNYAPMSTYNNGRWNNAVGSDVDIACGQCHGGGDGSGPNPYGLTLPNPAPPTFTRAFLAQAAAGMHNTNSPETSVPPATSTVVPTPVFTPPAGTYASTQLVSIADANSKAVICYSTTGTPTITAGVCGSGSTQYSTPISVSATTTIKATAGVVSGLTNSAVASGTYTISAQTTTATPTFSVAAGQFNTAQSLYLLDLTPGAVICYTTATGTNTPATPAVNMALAPGSQCTTGTQFSSSSPIQISTASETNVMAIAGAAGYSNSAVTANTKYNATVATPSFNTLSTGTYNGTQSVTLLDLTANAVICYSTTGTASITAGVCGSGSTQYSGPISVAATETISAIAGVASGLNNSATSSAAFTINTTTPTPTLSLGAGTYAGDQSLVLSDSLAGATICYTINSSAPTMSGAACTNGTQYTGSITIPTATTSVVNAIAGGIIGMTNSAVVGPVVFNAPVTPTITPVAQTYYTAQVVTIADLTSNASIFYSTTGAATCSSTLYAGPIPVAATETIQAVACVDNVASAPVTKTFTIAVNPPVFTAPAGARYYSLALQSSNPTTGATLPSGTYVATSASPLKVALSNVNSSAIVCYTTNGTTPTVTSAASCGNGTLYTTALSVSASETITAVAGTGTNSSPAAVLSLSIAKTEQ
jgi:hypothetical protein